jgi:hypothetical protein
MSARLVPRAFLVKCQHALNLQFYHISRCNLLPFGSKWDRRSSAKNSSERRRRLVYFAAHDQPRLWITSRRSRCFPRLGQLITVPACEICNEARPMLKKFKVYKR